jgi:glycosyltransferase involved in cell wall biosynthesis
MSGPANQAFMISKLLSKRSNVSPIFTSNIGAKKEPIKENMDGVEVRRMPVNFSFMKYYFSRRFRPILEANKPDIIHAHNFRSYQGEAAFRSAKKLGVPYVINTHGGLLGYTHMVKGIKSWPYRLYDKFIGRKIINEASAVIVSSKQEKDEALSYGVDEEKLHVIPMGIDIKDYLSIKRTRKDDKLRLLFVGRICRDRNLMPILEALREMKNIELRIIGGAVKRTDTDRDGYLLDLKEYVKRNGLPVKFTGPKYGKELRKEYRNADIFVYTSVYENFGQTLLEAAASALPIISTDVGIAKDIVKDGKTGYIIKDAQGIVEAVEFLNDKDTRKRFGIAVAKIAKKDFDWDDIIMAYEKIYLGVLK